MAANACSAFSWARWLASWAARSRCSCAVFCASICFCSRLSSSSKFGRRSRFGLAWFFFLRFRFFGFFLLGLRFLWFGLGRWFFLGFRLFGLFLFPFFLNGDIRLDGRRGLNLGLGFRVRFRLWLGFGFRFGFAGGSRAGSAGVTTAGAGRRVRPGRRSARGFSTERPETMRRRAEYAQRGED